MITTEDKSFIILIVSLFLLSVLGLFFVLSNNKKYTEQMQQKNDQMKKEGFQEEILMAMRVTSDPCADIFFELVVPPEGLGEKPKLIIMGQEASYSPFDSSRYFLSSRDDKVELWRRGVALSQIRFSTKVGEKYSPDSKFCRDKEKLAEKKE